MGVNILPFPPSGTSTAQILPQMSPLERARLIQKQKRSLPVTIKTEYLDDDAWVALASGRGWHLPQKNTQASAAGVAPWLKRLGLDKPAFREWCGFSPEQWCKHNSSWSLRAMVGLLLEDFAYTAQEEEAYDAALQDLPFQELPL